MLGWFSEASTLASRSKRTSRSRMLRKGGGQNLDRYFTIQLRVFGPIHFAMPPLPSGVAIFVSVQRLSYFKLLPGGQRRPGR
jgi:hypothetical protein